MEIVFSAKNYRKMKYFISVYFGWIIKIKHSSFVRIMMHYMGNIAS